MYCADDFDTTRQTTKITEERLIFAQLDVIDTKTHYFLREYTFLWIHAGQMANSYTEWLFLPQYEIEYIIHKV